VIGSIHLCLNKSLSLWKKKSMKRAIRDVFLYWKKAGGFNEMSLDQWPVNRRQWAGEVH
jgi:hypothetical protein